MLIRPMPQPLPAGYKKTYLSVAMSRAYGMDNPVGDPFGGPAYGEKNGPVAAIALPVLGMAGSYAAFGAATTVLGAVMAGAAFVGSAMSLVGNLTGNAKLSKFGSVLSLAGGLGMGADKLLSGGNFTFSGGEASAAPEWLQSTQGKLGMTPATTPVAPAEAVRTDIATGVQPLPPAQSMAANNLNVPGGGASPVNTPGGATAPINNAPTTPAMVNTANNSLDPVGSLIQQKGLPIDPSYAENLRQMTPMESAWQGAKDFGKGAMEFANKNPGSAMVLGQAAGGLADWLSGKTDAEIAALEAQVGFADARALQIQEEIAREKRRRINLNEGYQNVNANIAVNPNVTIPQPWQQPQPGLIAGNMPARG